MTETAELSFVDGYVFSTDHKVIGKQFLFTAMGFFTIGGLLAILMRTQLAWPWQEIPIIGPLLYGEASGNILPPESYPALVTMHGTIMIFFFIIPILSGALGNFLIPLDDRRPRHGFPSAEPGLLLADGARLSAGALELLVTTGPASAGWTSYAPLSILQDAAPGSAMGQTLWVLSLHAGGDIIVSWGHQLHHDDRDAACPRLGYVSSADDDLGAFYHSHPGDLRHSGAYCRSHSDVFRSIPWYSLFRCRRGASHLMAALFWFYSHPAVYIMILPAMGVASDVISTFSRKPLFGYKPMVYSLWAHRWAGFIVWDTTCS